MLNSWSVVKAIQQQIMQKVAKKVHIIQNGEFNGVMYGWIKMLK